MAQRPSISASEVLEERDVVSPDSHLILVGTPATLLLAHRQIGLLGDVPRVVGYIVLGDTSVEDNPDLPTLSGLDGIRRARDEWGVRTALVSLPATMTGTIVAVRDEIRRLGMTERFLAPLHEAVTANPPYVVGRTDVYDGAGVDRAARINIESLLERQARTSDSAGVRELIRGRRILITGAGGSIGSELARRAARLGPSVLILMERSENALFEIDRVIGSRFIGVPRRAILHDVVNAELTMRLLDEARPDVIFHAAAHKHVPLMEEHPAAAVVNNLFGTKSIADAALAVGAGRFVMVSTDKAVNPTSVMGATKRLAELYVQGLAAANAGPGATRFSMVRFGNVLGSACSVIQIWSSQLVEGGPITVTDPRMTRYFMTIPEAAELVMQAAALDNAPVGHAPVYVLDMGEPVRILDLAKRFILAHGLEPRVAGQAMKPREAAATTVSHVIDIVFTGIRPGEKLHEELAYPAEHLSPTGHPAIRAWTGRLRPAADVANMMEELAGIDGGEDRGEVINVIRRHLPEMSTAA